MKFPNICLLCIVFLELAYLAVIEASDRFHFRQHPTNQSILIASDLLLKCSIGEPHSNTPFHIQWRTNRGLILSHQHSHEIPGYSGRYSYVKETTEELHLRIMNVTLEDDGIFQCQVLKPGGKFLKANAVINVLVPPVRVHFPHYQSGGTIVVNEGTQMNITCRAQQSKPAAELSIFLNGKKALESDLHRSTFEWENGTIDTYASLALWPGKMHHNKMISCEANHAETGTKIRDSITLDVLYSSDRPSIDLIGADVDRPLKAGQNITLLCTAEGGNPPPELLWSNQNGQIDANYTYDASNQITRNALSIMVQGTDNGIIYECMSQTHANMTPLIARWTLHVEYPPANVFIFGHTTVRKGETLTMSCSSSLSSPASMITWHVNGSPTKMQPQEQKKQVQGLVTESNITIDSNMLLHGQHQINVACMASNGHGMPVSKSHVIRVLSPPSHPTIVESEPNNIPLEGTMYNLTCEAQGGHPFATLSWFRGVEKLKEADSSLNGDSSRSTLTLTLDRSMNYQQIRCEAENGATDLPLIAKKNLLVLFPPNQVRIQPTRNVHMIAGNPTELTCLVPSSNPVADLSWEFPNNEQTNRQLTITRTGEQQRKSNKPVGEYRGYESENIIQFTPTESMDKAEVRCIASHHLWNEVKYGSYALDIKYPPRIAVEGQMSIVVGEGQSFEENITIFANPRVNAFAWRKNGITIDRSVGTIYVRQSIIGGVGVTKEDTGIYTLFVSNGVGTANTTLKLIVEYAARITYVTSPVIASVGEDVVLECEADGMPMKPGMIKWLRGQNEVKSLVQDQRRAVIRMNASHENSGAYTCFVDNGIGQPNYTTAYLLVRRAPEIVKRSGFNRSAGPLGGRATLRCRASAVPNAEFTWGIEGEGHMIHHNTSKYRFFDTQLDHTTFQSTLTILHLEEGDYMRRYRCRVSNRLGLAQTFISVGPPTTPDQPSELEIVNVTNSSASISWIPGFDGGSDQLFELIYQDMDENQLHTINTTDTQIVLRELQTKHSYSLQIRSINMRGDISELTQPLIFRTLDENQRQHQNNGIADIISKSGAVSRSTIVALCVGLLALLLLNCVLICYLNRRNKRRRAQEKRTLSSHNGSSSTSTSSNGGGARTIQIYGAMSALHPQQQQQQLRPVSTPTTNRSDLMVQPAVDPINCGSDQSQSNQQMLLMDDNQSARTIIEVSPYGQFNGGAMNDMIEMNNDYFYNANCIAEFETVEPSTDYYAKIQKGNNNNYSNDGTLVVNNFSMGPTGIDPNLSYLAAPNLDPPAYCSNGMVLYPAEHMEMGPSVMYAPPSPYMDTHSSVGPTPCFVPAPAAQPVLNYIDSGGTLQRGSLQRRPKMMSTFQHSQQQPNTDNNVGSGAAATYGISIRENASGDLV